MVWPQLRRRALWRSPRILGQYSVEVWTVEDLWCTPFLLGAPMQRSGEFFREVRWIFIQEARMCPEYSDIMFLWRLRRTSFVMNSSASKIPPAQLKVSISTLENANSSINKKFQEVLVWTEQPSQWIAWRLKNFSSKPGQSWECSDCSLGRWNFDLLLSVMLL